MSRTDCIKSRIIISTCIFILLCGLQAHAEIIKIRYGDEKYMFLVRNVTPLSGDSMWLFKPLCIDNPSCKVIAFYDRKFIDTACSITYVNNKREGIFELRNPTSAQVVYRGIYANNFLASEEYYYSNGGIKWHRSYDEYEHQNGQSIEYYSSGQVASLNNYHSDTLLGTQYEWYENGILRSRIPLPPDNVNSLAETFWPNGQLHMQFQVCSSSQYRYLLVLDSMGLGITGQYSDNWKEYYADKKLKSCVKMNNGFMEGVYIQYDTAGNKRLEITYAKGVKNGSFYKYDDKGNIIYSCEYLLGVKNGQELYYQDGELIQRLNWDHGKLTEN